MLAKKKNYSDYEIEIDGSPKPVLRQKKQANGMFVKMRHLLMFLSFLSGMMFLVFIAGYHAGKVNGRNSILEEVNTNSARLPMVTTMAKGQTQDILSLVKAKTSKVQEKIEQESTQRNFDFANSEKLPTLSLSPGWYLQVAATGSLEQANKIKRSVEAKKQNAFIKRIAVRQKSVFKILVGPYNTKKVASSKSKLVKVTKVAPFAIEIK